MRRAIIAAVAASLLVSMLLVGPSSGADSSRKQFVKQVSGTVGTNPSRSSGTKIMAPKPHGAPTALSPSLKTFGCSDRSPHNVRANQECTNQSAPGFLGRGSGQNETAVAVNPTNPRNVLATQNDYRHGDSACGVDYSLDGGKHFGDGLLPTNFARGFAGGARHYFTTAGDPTVAFDSTGEAYYTCLMFNRPFPTNDEGDASAFGSSALGVFRSADGGASWSFPGDYIATTVGAARGGTVALVDKPYMAIDINPGSPFLDRIYVSWTNYPADFSTAPIFFAYSADHGVTWHQSGMINGVSPTLCPVTFGSDAPGTCNNSSFSEPFVAPNGDVFVTFINGNNCNGAFGCGAPATDNHFQMLVVKSTDGGNTFAPPVKVGDYNEVPDCLTYTGNNPGLACIPTAPLSAKSIFRAANYPSGVALSNTRIVIDYASYINGHSNPANAAGHGHCVPAGFSPATGQPLYDGVGVVNGCNNDIVRSVSTDGGASFTGTTTPVAAMPSVNNEGTVLADQWWQWTDKWHGRAVSSYYDRKYGEDQSSGFMDFSLADGSRIVRVTDRSMPPANDFPGASGFSTFMGDYTGLAIGRDGVAHPLWADTRNPIYTFNLAGDARDLVFAGYGSDIYTAAIHLHP